MKVFITISFLLCINIGSYAQANVTLSNLSQATKINASLKPKTTNTFDLGKPDSAWKNLYLNGSVFLNGKQTVHNVTDINDNLLFGDLTGINITTGSANLAIGNRALNQNQSGSGNVAIGEAALFLNTASNNTAVGDQAMLNNTSGLYNSSLGYNTLTANTTGIENTAIGALVLQSNSTGSQNTSVGFNSMPSNTTGNFNAAFGHASLFSNTTGYSNVALGYSSLFNNINGYQNTASGVSSMLNNTSGFLNTASGFTALYSNTTGSWNTAIGTRALYTNTAQDKNTAIGWSAGDGAQSAASTYIGFNAHASAVVSGSTALGINATVTASNQVRIGTSAITSIGGYVNWSNISDGRYKRNIKSNVPGLLFINSLTPVTYTLDIDALDKKLNPAASKNNTDAADITAKEMKSKTIYTGFVAQDVEAAAKKIGFDFSGIDAPKNKDDLYGLRYAEFVVPLVKAMQELSAKNDEKDKAIAELTKEVQSIKEQLSLVLQQTSIASSSAGLKQTAVASAALQQNAPNPFDAATTIKYDIPFAAKSASLTISTTTGQVLKVINLNSKGIGEITINGGDLQSGTYYYTLVVDGKQTATKQMLVIK